MAFTITFVKLFFAVLAMISPILLTLAAVIVVLGLIAGHREGWRPAESLYWAAITAFTVGYGDIRPRKPMPRFLAVAIAWTGIMFTGVIVAVTVASTQEAVKQHVSPAELKEDLKRVIEDGTG